MIQLPVLVLHVEKPKLSQFILPFQYLRGIVAVLVVWFHNLHQLPGLENRFRIPLGSATLYLFIIFSGFVMVITTDGKKIAPLDFFQRRLIRIAPLYWILTLLLAAIVLINPVIFRATVLTPAGLIQSLFFIPHYSASAPAELWPLLIPGWTLQFEMFFCVMFGASLMFKQHIPLLAITLIGGVLAGVVWGPFQNPLLRNYTNLIILDFVVGIMLGRFWMAGRLGVSWHVALCLFVVGLGLSIMGRGTPFSELTAVVGAALIASACFNAPALQWRNAALLALGSASYSIYLTHTFTLRVFRWVWLNFQPGVPGFTGGLVFMLLAATSCIIVGGVTYRWIETPIGKYLSDYLRQRGTRRLAMA